MATASLQPAPTPKPPRGRRTRYGVALVAVLALVLSSCLSVGQDHALSALNSSRNRAGRSSLNLQRDAHAKAQAWAEKLASENRLYHSNLSDGINPRWCSLGENVGYGGHTAAIQAAFMNSSGHRANVLSSKWTGVGIGVAKNGNRVYVVQVFIQTC